ncbi:MAG: hypothetical protein IJ430_00700 [Parabacteroides sp.]|nr:hypothetical protein [Parabacteroides sp.]
MKKNFNNIFISVLKLLKVSHTKKFSELFYNQYPLNNTLWGLSKMLSDYNIPNEAYHIKDKNKGISFLEYSCVIYWGGNFIIFIKNENNFIYYYWNGSIIKQPVDIFLEHWSGVVLYLYPNENSIEPEYKKHFYKNLFSNTTNVILIICIIALLTSIGIGDKLYKNTYNLLMFITNTGGAIISYLLLLKQLNISKYIDTICNSLLKKSECGNVIDSSHSKFFNLFSWAEVGFSYFISNILILILFNNIFIFVCIFNIVALPFTIWSIWCQKYVIKQWCSLCLLVQIILWIIFFINCISDKIYWYNTNYFGFLSVGLIYTFLLFIINQISHFIEQHRKLIISEQKFKSLKGIKDIFNIVLERENFYPVKNYKSNIVFHGSNNNNTIYYFTNPYCEPCAKKHNEIDSILNTKKHCTIKFIFLSFGDKWDDGGRCLIAAYYQHNKEKTLSIYRDWFLEGKYNKDSFIKKYQLDIYSSEVEKELANHKMISKELNISTTPLLLINGYVFPYLYDMIDLNYL